MIMSRPSSRRVFQRRVGLAAYDRRRFVNKFVFLQGCHA